jgi:hypothetical protein
MSDTSRKTIGLGCLIVVLLIAVVLLLVFGGIVFGFLPGRGADTPRPVEPAVTSKPTQSQEDLAVVVERLGGQLFPEEPRGTHFVKLTDARFESKQLEQLSPFQSVVELSLLNTKTDDEALESVVKLKNLRALNLSKTQITSKGLAVLAVMGKLEKLDISFTRVHDREFEPLLTLSGLKILTLDKTQTTLRALQVFERLESLENIYRINEGGGRDNVWTRGLGIKASAHYWKRD